MNFNHIKVNGKVFNCTGRSVVINNDSIIVDGKVITGGDPVNSITVIIEGDVSVLECAGSVTVQGNAGNIDCGGSCTVNGNVNGDIDAGGSITCGNVQGDVDAGGSVVCKY